MIRLLRLPAISRRPAAQLTRRGLVLMTLSNLLILVGAVLLLYVGGLYANAEYGRYAARGDTDIPAPRPFAPLGPADGGAALAAEPAPFTPALGSAPLLPERPQEAQPSQGGAQVGDAPIVVEGRVTGAVPLLGAEIQPSMIHRITIPGIDVDSKVVPVGWEIIEEAGQRVAVWQVAEYAVGHHFGSANPGQKNNIVLAGHVGGYGKVFRHLNDVQVGDAITVESAGATYRYTVSEVIVVDEEGVSAEQRAENARYIQPTDHEVLTLVTCWPPSGPDRFKQRIIVRALPARESAPTRE